MISRYIACYYKYMRLEVAKKTKQPMAINGLKKFDKLCKI